MSIRVENSLNLGGLLPGHVTRDALDEGAQHIGKAAQDKAPLLVDLKKANDQRRVDPGALRDSMYTQVVDDTTAEVGFSEFYAGWQHERTDYHHEVGQAKFLEEPLATEKDDVMELMAARIREGLDT